MDERLYRYIPSNNFTIHLDGTRPRIANLSKSTEIILPARLNKSPVVSIEVPTNGGPYELLYEPEVDGQTKANIDNFLRDCSESDYYEYWERIFRETSPHCTYIEDEGVRFGIYEDITLFSVDNNRNVRLHPKFAGSNIKTDGTVNKIPEIGLSYKLNLSGEFTNFECSSHLYHRENSDLLLQTYIGANVRGSCLRSLQTDTKNQLESPSWDDEFAKYVISPYIKAKLFKGII